MLRNLQDALLSFVQFSRC